MKEDVFAQTAQIKKNFVQIMNTLDEIEKSIHSFDALQEEVRKLNEAKEALNKLVFNLDEIEHLVIVSAIGRIDD